MLEEENPGCFDMPDKTFIDLYMKFYTQEDVSPCDVLTIEMYFTVVSKDHYTQFQHNHSIF